MANTYLTRTIGTTGNRKTFIYSTWIKRGNIGSYKPFMGDVTDAGNDYFTVSFQSADHLNIYSQLAGPEVINISTNRLFRDTFAWYHIVIATDTTQATASDRVKIYINGVQETSFSVATYPNQNTDLAINISGETQVVGAGHTLSSATFDGSMSHAHFIDGTAYDATAFGEFDANGVWKINTSPSVTYGTNGFFILKNGNSVTDQSGNGNNFTVGGGTLTNTEDSPSNVFATWNPLVPLGTFSNGNTIWDSVASGDGCAFSTLAVSSGKYYAEVKCTGSTTSGFFAGVAPAQRLDGVSAGGSSSTIGGVEYGDSKILSNGSEVVASLPAISQNDIIGIALDMDAGANGEVKFFKNGTAINGGTAVALPSSNSYCFTTSDFNGGSATEASANFGNGYFGTTAVSSAGTNASGNGIFEYDVPTGFTALSTKGLNL